MNKKVIIGIVIIFVLVVLLVFILGKSGVLFSPGFVGCHQVDINDDGVVDIADLGMLGGQWGTIGPEGDITGDGIVDIADLASVGGNWGNECFEVGINLDGMSSYGTQIPYINFFKKSREWITSRADGLGAWDSKVEIPLRDDGYPLEIPYDPPYDPGTGADLEPQIVKTPIIDINGHYPAGNYKLMFEGTGSIRIVWDAGTQSYNTPGIYDLTITNPDKGIFLNLLESDVNDPIRNIQVIHEDYLDIYQTEKFYPQFVDLLRGFEVIRFMNWGPTNSNDIVSWEDRFIEGYYNQASFEDMIDLSNELGADMWVNVPHMADDGFVMNLAQLIDSRLEPELKVYVEYSNELWNNGFDQYFYVSQQGCADPDTYVELPHLPGDCFEHDALLRFQAKQSVRVFEIFENEFNDDSRLVKVLASRASESRQADTILDAFNDPVINPNGITADALAIAFYFGGRVETDIKSDGMVSSITVGEILDRAEAYIYDDVTNGGLLSRMYNNKPIADQYGVELIIYEGGQGLSSDINSLDAKFAEANRDPRMKEFYRQMFDIWERESGGLFMHLSFVSSYQGEYSWGALEYMDQIEVEGEPSKWQALQEYLTN